MAVYTPRKNITACEITSAGKHVILAYEGFQDLVAMQLRGPDIDHSEPTEVYGDAENTGKTFTLSESDVC